MKRVIEAEMEIRAKSFKTALNKFFKKYPELDYWKEVFEYMFENNKDHEINDLDCNGNKIEWSYSLWLDVNYDSYYFCVIERAQKQSTPERV